VRYPNFGYRTLLRSAPLREFLAQFELISLANKWDDFSKFVFLSRVGHESEGESSFGFRREGGRTKGKI